MQVSNKERRNGLYEFWTPTYSTVNIYENVDDLNINIDANGNWKKILKTFPTFFGGG